MKFCTIHPYIPRHSYGYEKSQLCRDAVLDNHRMIYYGFYRGLVFDDYVKHMESIGFNDYHHVVLDMSDISRDKFTKRIDSEFGYTLYTSGKFLEVTSKGITVFNSLGENVCEYIYSYPFDIVKLFDKGQCIREITNEELLVNYLAASTFDMIFRDDSLKASVFLRRFIENTNRYLHQFVHYDYTDQEYTQDFPTKFRGVEHIYTNELLAEREGGVFLPPVFTKVVRSLDRNGYVIVASKNPFKRVSEVIELFKDKSMKDNHLYVYGYDRYDVDGFDNIHLMGHVNDIPYHKYKYYISNSVSESFSNAMAESLANGLTCFGLKRALAHQYHYRDCENVYLFESIDELKKLIFDIGFKEIYDKRFECEKVRFLYARYCDNYNTSTS